MDKSVLPTTTLADEDLRPAEFCDWWGANREQLCRRINQDMRDGYRYEDAPCWVLDEMSRLEHDIALAAWRANGNGCEQAAYRGTMRAIYELVEPLTQQTRLGVGLARDWQAIAKKAFGQPQGEKK